MCIPSKYIVIIYYMLNIGLEKNDEIPSISSWGGDGDTRVTYKNVFYEPTYNDRVSGPVVMQIHTCLYNIIIAC